LMLKSRAIHLANSLKMEGKNEEVIYVSLASDTHGSISAPNVVKGDTIFDLQSRKDFKETSVTFLSMYDIGRMCARKLGLSGHNDVEKLMKFLVEEAYPNAHFFVDEVLIGWINKLICCFKNKPESYTWLAISAELDFFPRKMSVKEVLAKGTDDQENYHFPEMGDNLRNCHQISELATRLELGKRRFSAKCSNSKFSFFGDEMLPANSVPGSSPVIIPFYSETDDVQAAIRVAVTKYFPTESVVILIEEMKTKKLLVNRTCCSLEEAGWTVTTYDMYDPGSHESWNSFLRGESKILITDACSFKGNQADNVIIVFFGDVKGSFRMVQNRLRNMILRCATTCVLLFSLDTSRDEAVNLKIYEFVSMATFRIDDVFSHFSADFSYTRRRKKAKNSLETVTLLEDYIRQELPVIGDHPMVLRIMRRNAPA
jgi:hypothetical protein